MHLIKKLIKSRSFKSIFRIIHYLKYKNVSFLKNGTLQSGDSTRMCLEYAGWTWTTLLLAFHRHVKPFIFKFLWIFRNPAAVNLSRPYTAMIKRCDESLVKLATIQAQMIKLGVPIEKNFTVSELLSDWKFVSEHQ